MNINELYLKTIFCCMACDGDIADEEVNLVSKIAAEQNDLAGLDIETQLNAYVAEINTNGIAFLKGFLKELSAIELTEEQQLHLVDYAVRTIHADEKIEYSEVKFFKKIRNRLSLSDKQILEHQQADIEDWLLPDIQVAEDPDWGNISFANIKI